MSENVDRTLELITKCQEQQLKISSDLREAVTNLMHAVNSLSTRLTLLEMRLERKEDQWSTPSST